MRCDHSSPFFQALTVLVAFYANAGDFDGTTLLNPRVYGRIEMGLSDVVDLLKARATGTRAGAGGAAADGGR
jgi:FMN reductase